MEWLPRGFSETTTIHGMFCGYLVSVERLPVAEVRQLTNVSQQSVLRQQLRHSGFRQLDIRQPGVKHRWVSWFCESRSVKKVAFTNSSTGLVMLGQGRVETGDNATLAGLDGRDDECADVEDDSNVAETSSWGGMEHLIGFATWDRISPFPPENFSLADVVISSTTTASQGSAETSETKGNLTSRGALSRAIGLSHIHGTAGRAVDSSAVWSKYPLLNWMSITLGAGIAVFAIH